MSDSAELFQIVIDDHRRRPRNRGPLPTANRVARRENPACGDLCSLQLRVEDGRVVAACFTGAGCALSQASASLATVALAGRPLPEARALVATVETLVLSGSSPAPPPNLGDLGALAAIHAFPARHACALLVWRAAAEALADETPARAPGPP
jgi:nitrogen fixation NifU-like protein